MTARTPTSAWSLLTPVPVLSDADAVFDSPPPDPLPVIRTWLEAARTRGAVEPDAFALATADARGRPSNRVVRILAVGEEGLLFASHLGSRKGRDLAHQPYASLVAYWPATDQQLVVSGPVTPTTDAVSDHLWAARAPGTHAMSVAARQSEPLDDETALLAHARRLGQQDEPLPRPRGWVGYVLAPTSVEFWHVGTERLHRRLCFERGGRGWEHRRLQP